MIHSEANIKLLHVLASVHQPTYALNKIHSETRIKLLHVGVLYLLLNVLYYVHKFDVLIKVVLWQIFILVVQFML
jgi:tRNA A37 threonylcarbamoyladenosine biosynthesis protein TsaE